MPRLPLFLLTLPIVLAAGACDRQTAGDKQQQEASPAATGPAEGEALNGVLDRSHAGGKLPEVTVTDPTGTTLDLTKATGKPVLLNVWATWCVPCITEMPLLDQIAGDYQGQIRVLTVSEDLKGAELVKPFFAEKKFAHLPMWLDQKNNLIFGYSGDGNLPLTVYFDAQGKELWRVTGGFDWSGRQAHDLIAEGLASG